MEKFSIATWEGSGISGTGLLTTESKHITCLPYTFDSRFREESNGSNPEELLAAAHASCFTMKLSFVLEQAGFNAKTIRTTAKVRLVNGVISESTLEVRADISGISQDSFFKLVQEASRFCPIGRVLNIPIILHAYIGTL